MHQVSPELAKKLTDVYGDVGREWIVGFPQLLERFRQQWGVAELEPTFPYVGYSWVAPGKLADGTEVVLKLAPTDKEFANEIVALGLYDGRGAVRLLASESTATALLLERLRPGGTLAESVEDDTAATEFAAGVFGNLFRELPESHSFPTVERWGQAFERVTAKYNGGSGIFPAELFQPAHQLYFDLCRSASKPVLLHGDLHHWNILSATREPWLAIDAKGVAGEPAYEVGAFLRNRTGPVEALPALLERRARQFSEHLQLDYERVMAWSFATAVLSVLWWFEDHGTVKEEDFTIARALRELL